MDKIVYTKNESETISLGEKVSHYLFKGSVILLSGDLGAGKTTFTKGVGLGLGIKDDINSPTFNIAKCYFNDKNLNLYHIDAYRLEDVPSENKEIGLDELIDGDGVCLVEWPNFIKDMVDEKRALNISITIENDLRKFVFKSDNSKYDKLFEEIN